jgi:hypothetical protein
MAPKPLLRIRSTAKKTFGAAFGAATGVSDPRLQKNRIRKNGAGGDAATVAGYAGPGFHNWPSGHIPQDTAPKPLLRIRSTVKKTFGAAFGAATGVSDPRLQKNRIRNDHAGKLTSRRVHGNANVERLAGHLHPIIRPTRVATATAPPAAPMMSGRWAGVVAL